MYEILQWLLAILIFGVVIVFGIGSAFIPKPKYVYDDEPEPEQKEKSQKEIYSPYDTINS